MSAEFATYLFSFIEKIAPGPITSLVGEALNKRLGTEGLSVSEVAIEAAKRGIELVKIQLILYREIYMLWLKKMNGYIVMVQVKHVQHSLQACTKQLVSLNLFISKHLSKTT